MPLGKFFNKIMEQAGYMDEHAFMERLTVKHQDVTIQPQDAEPLPPFHPMTIIRQFDDGTAIRLFTAQTHAGVMGSTGSGKTSGFLQWYAYGLLTAGRDAHPDVPGMGGLILTTKLDERRMWEKWLRETGRLQDLIVIDRNSEHHRFNFLESEATREGGGGMALNIVSLIDEADKIASGHEGGGGEDGHFWQDACHSLCLHIVNLILLAQLPVSFRLMREIVNTAAQSLEETRSEEWQKASDCYALIREADRLTAEGDDPEARADFEEEQAFFLQEFPALNDRTRTSITTHFSIIIQPFLTRPLRKLFSTDSTFRMEDTWEEGKIILVDLPVQDFKQAGRIAQVMFKYVWQQRLLARKIPTDRPLRPAFLIVDECQNFITNSDAHFASVARGSGCCMCLLTQNQSTIRRVLGSDDQVESLLGNTNIRVWHAGQGETNEKAARLLGEHWAQMRSTNHSSSSTGEEGGSYSESQNFADQRRFFLEPYEFTSLRRGGFFNRFEVDAIMYIGGEQFPTVTTGIDEDGNPKTVIKKLPYKRVTFTQAHN